MPVPSVATLQSRPVATGLLLGVVLVFANSVLAFGSLDAVPVLLFAAGILLVIWGAGDQRRAGVASAVAGLVTVVLLELAAALGQSVLLVVLLLTVLGVVGAVS